MKEIWKPVKDFEDYEVSNLGNVRNKDGYLLSLNSKIHNGYTVVTLTKTKRYLVHRLVAETFLENPENKLEVNHKDSDRTNNSVNNLEWVTKSENIQHSYTYGNKKAPEGTSNGKAVLSEQDVKELRNIYIPHSKEFGMKVLAQRYGVSEATINRVVHNRSYKNVK